MDCSPPDLPGKDTGVDCYFLLQGIFPTQGLNSCFLHCRQILYQLSYKGSPLTRLTVVIISLYTYGCVCWGVGISSVQLLSHVQCFATPWSAAIQDSPSVTNCWSVLTPLSWWCHPTISSSVVPFSSCLQSFQASGSFQMSQFFWSDDQSIGVSTSASVLPVNNQDWSPLRWTGWISLQSKGLLSSPTPQFRNINSSALSFFIVQLSHPYMTTGKTIALTRWNFASKVMSLLFNKLSRLVITFLPRSKHLLISWLLSPSTVILEPKKLKSVTVPLSPHLFAMKWWDQMSWSEFSECWVLNQYFHSSVSFSSRGSLAPLHFVP